MDAGSRFLDDWAALSSKSQLHRILPYQQTHAHGMSCILFDCLSKEGRWANWALAATLRGIRDPGRRPGKRLSGDPRCVKQDERPARLDMAILPGL